MTTLKAGAEGLGRVLGKGREPQELVALGGSEDRLTDEQVGIVSAPIEPCLVVAGAGSGKTETLSLRFVYLLDHARKYFGRDLSPDEVLCLTFTRKAATEIAERVSGRIDRVFGPNPDRPLPTVSTYNAYAAGLVSEHGLRVGVDPESTLLTDASLWQLAARIAETWDGSLDFEGNLESAAAAIPSLASSLADHGVTTAEYADFLGRIAEAIEELPLGPRGRKATKGAEMALPFHSRASLAALVDGFRAAKRGASSLDFSDQIAVALELTRLPAVQALERARYRAVLLDEFQDTSPGQLDLFANLFGAGHPVMAVGDPLQAIYGFRGASEAALERFIDRFGIEGDQRMTLSVSWRNSADVLRVANAATEKLRASSSVQVPILRSRSEETGTVELSREHPSVSIQVFSDLEAEAAALASFIVERKATLARARDSEVECAVLCRARRFFPTIVTALKDAGLDYQVVGLGGLLNTPVVVDLVALLQVAHDPSRGDSLMRLLTSERIALGVRDIAALGEWAEEAAGSREDRELEASIVDALEDLPPRDWVSRDGRTLTDSARTRLHSLSDTIDSLRTHAHLPLPEFVLFAARAWNLDIEARVSRGVGACVGDEAIHALAEAARAFAGRVDHATLGAFLSWLQAASEHEDGLDAPVEEPRTGAVQVQTIHAAKGMEWDIVAIPGLVDGVFPKVDVSGKQDDWTYRSAGWLTGAGVLPWPLRRDRDRLPSWEWERASNLKELEVLQTEFRSSAGRHAMAEERRLFYVAVTRARSDILLTASPHPEARKPRPLSIFLRDLVHQGVVPLEAQPPSDSEGKNGPSHPSWPGVPTPAQEGRRLLAAEVLASIAEGPVSTAHGLSYAHEIEALLTEDQRSTSEESSILAPIHLSSTDLVRLFRDREAFALARRRPMPSEPTSMAHRGDAFHSWVERYFRAPTLIDPDEPICNDDEGGSNGVSLDDLQSRFLESDWSRRLPEAVETDVEVPFEGYVLRCRIDAVFPRGSGLDRVTVVDWKTGRPPLDPKERAAREVQLAVYRLAWAAWKGLPIEEVDAAFVYIDSGETVRPDRLLGREELLALMRGD